jgi:hypothetical protein
MRRRITFVVAAVGAVPAFGITLVGVAVLATASSSEPAAASAAAADIPPEYLRLYKQAAAEYELGPDGWAYLAGVGKVECDHGRSTAVGCDRGESNSAGARGPAQFLDPTWAAYGVDADGSGTADVYEPADAIFGMANYLHASGAPADWHRALFAYNHSEAYVADVSSWAQEYLAQDQATNVVVVLPGSGWLSPLPSFPGEQCDSRIVADVEALARAYGLFVSDCYGGPPHDPNGEHPLGLAVDAAPADGNWNRTLRAAQDFGWTPACAAAGCIGVGPFRAILYNGYPGHGDPAHSDRPHIHFSWQHAPAAPFSRAQWVKTLLPAPTSSNAACTGGRSHDRRRGAGRRCNG